MINTVAINGILLLYQTQAQRACQIQSDIKSFFSRSPLGPCVVKNAQMDQLIPIQLEDETQMSFIPIC